MRLSALPIVFALCLGLPAKAVPLCDDEQTLVSGAVDVAAAPASDEVAVILPCAVVESGDLGPLCLDATGWLITQSGVVLCQVTLPDTGLEPMVLHDRPVETLASFASALALGLVDTGASLSPPVACDRFVASLDVRGALSPAHVWRPVAPG